jgi:hypothetical protein
MVVAKHPTIVWQPCVAHTINLMLKEIRNFPEHDVVIQSARRVSRFLYNHNKLHSMIKEAIGGELVQWNATRFGTNYVFLESFLRRKDKFMVWMGSQGFLQSKFSSMPEGRYTHQTLTSLSWWDELKYVVDATEPLFGFLCFADEDRKGTLSEVLLQYTLVKSQYESLFQGRPSEYKKYIKVIKKEWRILQIRPTSMVVSTIVSTVSLNVTIMNRY